MVIEFQLSRFVNDLLNVALAASLPPFRVTSKLRRRVLDVVDVVLPAGLEVTLSNPS